MADNVAITAGTGTSIATDDISGAHYQRMKLSVGTADVTTTIGHAEDTGHSSGDGGIMELTVRQDSAAALAGADARYQPLITDATGRLWVRPAPVTVRISVTPTISTSPAYTAGDVLGGLQTVANAVRVSGGSGTILSVTVVDNTQAQRAAMDLFFFDRSITVAADNAAFATSDGDMAYCLGWTSIGPYNTAFAGTPLNSVSSTYPIGLPIVLNGTSLFVVACVRGTPTYVATNDLTFIYVIQQD